MKKFLLTIPFVFLLVGCDNSVGREAINDLKNGGVELSRGSIEYNREDFDFGTIKMSEGIVDTTFVLENKSSEIVAFVKGESSCICTEGMLKTADDIKSDRIQMHKELNDLSRQSLAPGEKATLTAYFDPNAHGPSGTGSIIREIRLFTNSKLEPIIQLRFLGNVVK